MSDATLRVERATSGAEDARRSAFDAPGAARPRLGFLGTGWIGRHRMEAIVADAKRRWPGIEVLIVHRVGKRARQARLSLAEPGAAALDQQRRGDHAGPGREPGQSGRRLVGRTIEIARAAGERVQHGRAHRAAGGERAGGGVVAA